MAEHPSSGPLEMGAEMDYPEHRRTYDRFLTITKYGTLMVVGLLVAMAFAFYTSAGFFSGVILWLLIVAVGAYAMR